MRRTAAFSLILVAAFAAAACRKAAKVESIAPQPASAESRPAEPPPAATPSAPSLDVGPAAGDREAQRQAVFALLAGELAADILPEVATEPGQALDDGLIDRLAPVSSQGPKVRGTASVGAATSDAPIANVARVSAGMRASFRACYNRALAQTPQATGVASMVLKVDRDGAVSQARATPSGGLPAAMLPCLEARARAARFDPPEGKVATVRFKVTFALQ